MSDLIYDYKPKTLTMAMAFAFFAACGLFGVHIAETNRQGLIIDGLIGLNVGQATVFSWVMCGAAFAMAAGGLLGVVSGFTSRQKLVLGDTAMRLPKSGLSNTILTIAYADIRSMVRQQVRSQHFLTIEHTRGKVSLVGGMLPNQAKFEEVCTILAQRVAQARQER